MTAEDEIRSAIRSFATAYRNGDIDALLACYSDDLIKDRAGAPSESKAQTAQRVRQVFRSHRTDIDVQVSEVLVGGDLACVRGAFTVTLHPREGGSPVSIARRYLEIWRNEDGAWRVIRTMDNEP